MGSRDSSDLKNWDNIFKTLVKIVHTKQDQLESLVKDRKLIEKSITTMEENWISDVRYYEDKLSLMKNEIETMKMIQLVETSKSNLLSGLNERDCYLCKLKLEYTMDELNDFRALFNLLSVDNIHKESDDVEECKRLKREVFDLLRENGFAWSQFKCVEKGFTGKLRRKDDEIARANTKISCLLSYQEELQSSNEEKDETISRLKAKVGELEKSSSKKDEEISKLKQELECLKKARNFTPVLTRCNGNEQGSNYSKRKRAVSVSETPKLFSSAFRVPKLKSPSSGAI